MEQQKKQQTFLDKMNSLAESELEFDAIALAQVVRAIYSVWADAVDKFMKLVWADKEHGLDIKLSDVTMYKSFARIRASQDKQLIATISLDGNIVLDNVLVTSGENLGLLLAKLIEQN
ncbi:MAG: hypothetical protein NC218_03990 [Acetobacter sp.]|nr:hypothetical protein [Acetobacter sp.]